MNIRGITETGNPRIMKTSLGMPAAMDKAGVSMVKKTLTS